ncbi:MAG TPA: hypothetical protein VK458_09590, partial [Myxococcaceae bacterium]|nr:hypothetical protein [Myxococcaceae bacterium]
MRTLLKVMALWGLVLAGCLVPTREELEQEKVWLCDAEHPCLPGYGCVEENCQPEQGAACRPGMVAECGQDKGECQRGRRTCSQDGTYGPCEGALIPPAAEACNGLDDDCDGTVDDGLSCGGTGDACAPCTAAGRTCANGVCGGCQNSHYAEGTECRPKLGLGKNCTAGSMCGSGFCVDGVCCGTAACNTPPNNQCYAGTGTCSGLTGECQYAALPNTTACEDGNRCTNSDRCDGTGRCASGTPTVCTTPSDSQCQGSTGTCQPTTGACVYPNRPEGSFCNDGSGCTGNDQCTNGYCQGTYLCAQNEYCNNNNQCVCDAPP